MMKQDELRRLAVIGGRGFAQVALLSANTYQVAHGHLVGATCVSFLISLLWWFNARSSSKSDDLKWAPVVYAVCSASGIAAGIVVMGWVYR